MSTRRVHLLGALAVLVAVAGSAAAGSGAAPGPAQARAEIPGFPLVVPCGFSHRNNDDPIVYPKQPGRSHDHSFFGNRTTNAFSSPASLRRSGRTTWGQLAD